ncbi:MAG: hypothetical protein JWM10_15 [Myxococcaceae bacterium]|nr:hypothetical protein [Myxococcaceae bacterium]
MRSSVPPPAILIAVVIATKDREAALANRALRSVVAQTRTPDFLVVIDDSHPRHREANRRIVDGVVPPDGRAMRVRYLRNDRTPGASGAWNVGLDWLHRQVDDCDRVMVAILDDDDGWEPDYLTACAALAAEQDLDMVAADIVRRAGAEPGEVQPAPDALRTADFLVRNPGIQGSNLFVRLGSLLAAGLFDEALPSTTDRDLCVRLADLGFVRYGRLARALVHHFADPDRPRLSQPGSPSKLGGLDGFYRKYHRRMSPSERAGFCERAGSLFGWQPTAPAAATASTLARPPAPSAETPALSLVVGLTTQSVVGAALTALLRDLTELRGAPGLATLDLVVLENGPRASDQGAHLAAVTAALREAGIDTVLIPLERQRLDATAGVFGRPFERGLGRASIAVARTMLQTYLYLWSKRRPGAVSWILDDDMRLDNLVWRGGPRVSHDSLDVVGTLRRLRETGVAVAIGSCTEAPPLPFASCVRTQLVDAWHNLALLARLAPDDAFPDLLEENMGNRARFTDYYYDLSRRETDQLETPFWYVPATGGCTARAAFAEMVPRLPRILAGEQVFRPLVHDAAVDPLDHLQPSVHRGGNTFVFDPEALWDFPNGVPSIGGGDTRRSDMVWSLLNRYGARRRVVKVPLPVRQQRADVETQRLDLDKLARDIHGYAIYSALDDLLLDRCERRGVRGESHLPDALDLTEREVEFATRRFRKYLAERLYSFQLSFHRAAGLVRALAQFLEPSGAWWWLDDPGLAAARASLRATLDLLGEEYRLDRLETFRQAVLAVDPAVVREWLDTLRAEILARRTHGAPVAEAAGWIARQREESVRARLERALGVAGLRVLGSGGEAVALTDGVTVYKCFDAGRLVPAQREFLRAQVGRWAGARTLYNLTAMCVIGGSDVLTYPYEPSAHYRGGHGAELRLFLEECRAAGVVFSNVHPDNLVVTADGALRFIDYGSDVVAFTEDAWTLMARRVWLSARHASHPDLKALLRASVDRPDLPELLGLDHFLRARPGATKEQLLDDRLEALALGRSPQRVFDYGCGKAALARSIGRRGIEVVAYDPDPRLAPRWASDDAGGAVRYCARRDDARAERGSFDVVVSALVLCVIDDEAELRRVLRDVASLVTPDGRVYVAVCNPDHVGRGTCLQRREPPADGTVACVTWKTLRASGRRRRDFHRPLATLRARLRESGLRLVSSEETAAFDPDTLDPSSDFLILELAPSGEQGAA